MPLMSSLACGVVSLDKPDNFQFIKLIRMKDKFFSWEKTIKIGMDQKTIMGT